MVKGLKVVEFAITQIGVKESPPNSNKVLYNDWFYNSKTYPASSAWCGTFVSYCLFMAGFKLPTIDYLRGFAGCPFAVKCVTDPVFMKANPKKVWGTVVKVPRAGDICFLDFNLDGRYDHVTIFISDLGNGMFHDIGGNTGVTNASDGGEVLECNHKYKHAIFVRPKSLE